MGDRLRTKHTKLRRASLPAVGSNEGHRVTTLELFFDLAYVFAITQVSGVMAEHHNTEGIVQALVILALLWWSWTAYAWLSNQARADQGSVRVAMIIAMSAVFVAGLAVHETFNDLDGGLFAPMVFVGAYLVARITHAVVYMFAAFERAPLRRRVVATVLLSVVPSTSLLVAGALLRSPWQLWCWLAAVVFEPVVAYLRGRGVDWRVHSVEHFVERFGLVVILALGESIIAIGTGVSAEPTSEPILVGAVMAILIPVAMWWAYFERLAGRAEAELVSEYGAGRARAVNDGYIYVHLVLVAGIVITALGIEQAMAHISETARFGWFGAAALGGGLSCYLGATGVFARVVLAEWSMVRLAGAALLLTSTVALAVVPPIGALTIATSGIAAVLAVEGRSGRRSRQGG